MPPRGGHPRLDPVSWLSFSAMPSSIFPCSFDAFASSWTPPFDFTRPVLHPGHALAELAHELVHLSRDAVLDVLLDLRLELQEELLYVRVCAPAKDNLHFVIAPS